MKVNINNKEYDLIEQPCLHVLSPTKKELHGWWNWGVNKRECTSERLLINPYNGCNVNCFFCYALALPGYFEIFREKNIIFVCQDFDKTIAEQLNSIDVASCGYLSPITDPFQVINEKYKLSEKIIKIFVEQNIPIEFITKCKVPQEVIDMIKTQKHSFGQVSILTTDDNLRKILSPGGASVDELFDNIERLSKENIYSVVRIDPILPYITDSKKTLTDIVCRAYDSGAKHIIASVLDIPARIENRILNKIKEYFGTGIKWDYQHLYTERIGYINAKIDYRKKIFTFLRNLCDKKGLTFALCMEYELLYPAHQVYSDRRYAVNEQLRGLNKEFMSSINCEGMDVPVYIRKDGKFQPAITCKGNCLNCTSAKCGIEDLAMNKEGSKKDWKLKDYKRWSKELHNPKVEIW